MNKKLHLFFNLKLLFTFLADLITVLKYGIIGGLQFFQAVLYMKLSLTLKWPKSCL